MATHGDQELMLGRARPPAVGYGFDRRRIPRRHRQGRIVRYAGEGHLLTVAPTGAGKGRGQILPNLLLCTRSAIVVDPKGEAYAVTAGARRRMGHRVVRLDPFAIMGGETDRFNPLDLLALPSAEFESDAQAFAHLLLGQHRSMTDPYWSDAGHGLLSGAIAHVAGQPDRTGRNLAALSELLFAADLDERLAMLLGAGRVHSPLARREFSAYLKIPPDRTRPCVLSVVRCALAFLSSASVADSVSSSSFPLRDLFDDRPLTIYLVLPLDKLESHRALLRLWVHTLLVAVSRRERLPKHPTLFLIDEAAQLGPLRSLKTAMTFLRGSGGVQVWSFWQDLSQIRHIYPDDWQSLVNNCAVLQAFGLANPLMAEEIAMLLGRSPHSLLELSPDEIVCYQAGRGSRVLRRLDYLQEPVFRGQFAPNPQFAARPAVPAAQTAEPDQ